MKARIESRQIRAARGLLDWSQAVLAQRCGLSLPTIKRIEDDDVGASDPSLKAVVRALEDGGVVFVAAGDLEAGVGCGVAIRSGGGRTYGGVRSSR